MHRVQEGHQQVLIGQDYRSVDTHRAALAAHEFHLVKGLLGLAHRRGDGDHAQGLLLIVKRFERLCLKPLTVTFNEQGSRVMRGSLEHTINACVIPPEIGKTIPLEMVKQFDFGGRQDTKSHKHHPTITVNERHGLGCKSQLPSSRNYTLVFQSLVIGLIDG